MYQSLVMPGGILQFKCPASTRIQRTTPFGKGDIWPPRLGEAPSGKGDFFNYSLQAHVRKGPLSSQLETVSTVVNLQCLKNPGFYKTGKIEL